MMLKTFYKEETKILKERKERGKVEQQRKEGTIPSQSISQDFSVNRFKEAGKMKRNYQNL